MTLITWGAGWAFQRVILATWEDTLYTLTLWRRLLCFLASFRIPSVSVGEYDLCVAAVMGVAQQGQTFAADTHPLRVIHGLFLIRGIVKI